MDKKLSLRFIILFLIISSIIFAPATSKVWAVTKDKEAGLPAGQAGLSVLFVVDCSGSMKDNNKLEDAKIAARNAINKLSGVFEIAVIAFFDCGSIQVIQAFSSDKQSAISAIAGLSPDAATPLADALSYGRNYLMSNAKYEKKSLIVLSDGQETCGGNPAASFPGTSGRPDRGEEGTKDKDKKKDEKDKEYPSGII